LAQLLWTWQRTVTGLLRFLIPRHCVPRGPDGLSPLQDRILDDPAPVRVFSAPTGAGKSYAFRRAVSDHAARVLFIVPTRRLAQNLARALAEEMHEVGAAASLETAARRIVLWTSDERVRLREQQPDLNVGRLRVRQFLGLEAREQGDMIIATPESVAYFLLRPQRPAGLGDAGFPDLFSGFDHLVFDEFHTIEARGFGLAAACALVAARLPSAARVTLLSATPIRVRHVLEQLGVPPECIVEAVEGVITGLPGATGNARALHGDVVVEVDTAVSPADALEARMAAAADVLQRHQQVVLVYDSVARLLAEKERLAALCDRLGRGVADRLAINSVDDRAGFAGPDFTAGAQHDPARFSILVATSSIEVGVTFRAGMMLMQPGYSPAGFVQRIGRVARGDEQGLVVVCAGAEGVTRKAWLRTLLAGLRAASVNETILVGSFAAAAMAATARRFHGDPGSTGETPTSFRCLPQRAVWCAALFWRALGATGYRGLRDTLRAFAPPQARTVAAILGKLRDSPSRAAQDWAKAFEAEALRMRMVPERVQVLDIAGNRWPVPWTLYASHSVFVAGPAWIEASPAGGDVLCVQLDCTIGQALNTSERLRVVPTVDALFPDATLPCRLPEVGLADAWVHAVEARRHDPRCLPGTRVTLQMALELVRLTGLVPLAQAAAAASNSVNE